jgi:hypothetical protein
MDDGEQSGQGWRRPNRGVRRRHWGSSKEGRNNAPVAKLNVVFILQGRSNEGSSPRGSTEGGDGQNWRVTVRLFARSLAVARDHGEVSLVAFLVQADKVRRPEARCGVGVAREVAHRRGDDEDG